MPGVLDWPSGTPLAPLQTAPMVSWGVHMMRRCDTLPIPAPAPVLRTLGRDRWGGTPCAPLGGMTKEPEDDVTKFAGWVALLLWGWVLGRLLS